MIASMALAIAPQAGELPMDVGWSHTGDYGIMPSYDNGGTPLDASDDVFAIQDTVRELHLGLAPAGLAVPAHDASLDGATFAVPNPTFDLVRATQGELAPFAPPAEVYAGDEGLDVGWHLPLVGAAGFKDRDAGASTLDYNAAGEAGAPVVMDAHQASFASEAGNSTDAWVASASDTAAQVCVWAAEWHDVQAAAPRSEAACPDGLADAWQQATPNVAWHSEFGTMTLGLGARLADLADGAAPAAAWTIREAGGVPAMGQLPGLDRGAPQAAPPQPMAGDAGEGAPSAAPADGPGTAASAALTSQVVRQAFGLQVIAGAALAALLVPLYRRLVQGRVLQNDVRERLLAAVRARPGIHESAAAKDAGVGPNLAQYHVRMLVEFGLVEVRRFGGRKCLFPAGQMNPAAKALAATEHGAAARVVDLVAAQPGIGQRDLARVLAIGESSVKWHLDRLMKSGVIEVQRTAAGKQVRLHPDVAAARAAADARVAPTALVSPHPAPAGPAGGAPVQALSEA